MSALLKEDYSEVASSAIQLIWDKANQKLELRGQFFECLGLLGLVVGGFEHQARCWRIGADGHEELGIGEISFVPDLFHAPAAKPWRDTFSDVWIDKLTSAPEALQMLRLACLTGDAKSLLENHTFVFSAWCRQHLTVDTGIDEALSALHRPLKELAQEAGLPNNRQALKALAKIKVVPHTSLEVSRAINFMQREEIAWELRHIPRLDIQSLLLFRKHPVILSLPLKNAVFGLSENQVRQADYWLTEVTRLIRLLGDDASRGLLRNCRHPDQLENLHDRLSARWNERLQLQAQLDDAALREAFPPPPWRDDEKITALTCGLAVLNEGQRMKHCLASYSGKCLEGEFYAWHVEFENEKATVGAYRTQEGYWRISELRGPHNANPSSELKRYVNSWAQKEEKKRRLREGVKNVLSHLRHGSLRRAWYCIKDTHKSVQHV